MLNYLKKKFRKNKEVPASEQFYSPMRIALHSTIRIDSVDMVTLSSVLHPLFIQPKGDLTVNAIGIIDSDGTKIYQVYVNDENAEEFVLQLIEGSDYRSGISQIDEITLFKQVVTIEPETEASLDRSLADIGFLKLELDEIEYDRLWGDQYTEKQDFKILQEIVVTPQNTHTYTDNYILYGRDIRSITGDNVKEFLLVGLEENNNEAQIMMQVGLQLNITDIEIV